MAMKRFYAITRTVIFTALLFGLITPSFAQTTFNYTGSVQTYTVPTGISRIMVDVQGAKGGDNSQWPSGTYPSQGGNGGRVQAMLAVTAGQVLNIYVGGAGNTGSVILPAVGGYNGGGDGATYSTLYGGGAGGGATDIRLGGNSLADRIVVAGGGAGAGLDYPGGNMELGGAGGGLVGENGYSDGDNTNGYGGYGGTQTSGGANGSTSGNPGTLGNGGAAPSVTAAGGGGGGYYGGGSGGDDAWAAGGGGSSYTDAILASAVTHTQGYNGTGDGLVTITIPDQQPFFTGGHTQSLSVCQDSGPNGFNTYLTIFDFEAGQSEVYNLVSGPAHGTIAGLPDTLTSTGATITPSGIPTSITYAPAAGFSGLDTFTVAVDDSNGGTDTTMIIVTVNPTPTVNSISGQSVCNGDTTTTISFVGTPSGVVYTWSNSNATIGLASTGTGDIMSFSVTNTTSTAVTATISVTPSANGCTGTPRSFTITAKPTPMLSSTLAPAAVCDSTLFHYVALPTVTGTTFAWSRGTTPGITNPAATGADTVNEVLVNTTPNQVAVTYTFSMTAAGCNNVQTVVDTVNPRPVLDSVLTFAPICDSTLFSYIATSSTPGTYITWNRDTITGIIPGATFGTGNVSEVLQNTTNAPIMVTYVYTLLANGCSNTQSVTVTVNPKPTLSSSLTPAAICDSTAFFYVPASGITGTTVTYSWIRDTVVGINNSPASGTDTVNEVLVNTTVSPLPVIYRYTLSAYGCSNTQNVRVTVNPRPTLTTTTTPAAICDSTLFIYVPVSGTTGTTFSWSRPVMAGIANPAGRGVDTIRERLHNTTPGPITVIYYDTLRANGCVNIEQINVTVNPKPRLSTPLTPAPICDNAIFNYTPTSATTGTTFSWNRPFVPGIANVAGSGGGPTGNPTEQLDNTTNVNVPVTYIYTLTANGCSNIQNVVVLVHPTPTLSSVLTPTVCSGAPFNYTAMSFYPDSLNYKWTRASVTGITNGAGSGTTAIINETLTSSLTGTVAATYTYTLTIANSSCSNTQNVRVMVFPAPSSTAISLAPSSHLCSGTMFQNFGAAGAPVTGGHYSWAATNAQVWATGDNGQYALVNFNNPGNAVVTLYTNAPGTNCASPASYSVTVTSSVSDNPTVIYYNGQLICLQNNEDSYQWGYDDAITLEPTTIAGEVNATYIVNGIDPVYRYYWVMTKHGDCTQKSYYNAPTGVTNVNTAMDAGLNVFPNPASNNINIEINPAITGNVAVEIINIVGQKITSAQMQNHFARIDVSSLPAGGYIVNCLRDGVKIGTAKFIKN
jgi:hypothetical protein